jgi:hypothetical protein
MTTQNDLLATVQNRLANGENMKDISDDLHLGIIESAYLEDGTHLSSVTSTKN